VQFSWARGITCYQAYSSTQFATLGDCQAGRLLLSNSTSDATPTVLIANGVGSPSTNNQFILPSNSAMAVTGTVLAASTDGDTAMFTFVALLKNIAGTVSIVGSPTVTMLFNDTGASAWTIAIDADNDNQALSVVATGEAATTIFWNAEVRSQELVTI
jgi:hypothetical protein